jgi:tetratricopeptide (TPR) repeat protein
MNVIGEKYEVRGILGRGGLGIVYLVYSRELGKVLALKTFHDEFLADEEVRRRFEREAGLWIELGRHPYLVHAYCVESVAGRLYLVMEHIAPGEHGLNSLEGYLQQRPPDLAQSLRWAIQICHGMEYAYSRGVRAHRDLKPANILIGQDMNVRISDFGLAGVVSESPALRASRLTTQPGLPVLSGQTLAGAGWGTPLYMAPEQFDNAAACDERSDLYSFGIILYQMVAGGRLPFVAALPRDGAEPALAGFWLALRQLHQTSRVPPLSSPAFAIIQRCLEKSPDRRYPTFNAVRNDLAVLLRHLTGETVVPPPATELEAWEWSNKGASLRHLGHFAEAIRCYDRSLELFPINAIVLSNKGADLESLGRSVEAIHCFDQALALNPRCANAWLNKGNSLNSLGRHVEALQCFSQSLRIDWRLATGWNNEGYTLNCLGRYEEAIQCLDKALEIDPRDVDAWNNKGNSVSGLGRPDDAMRCYDQALKIDPRFVAAWNNKALLADKFGRYEESIHCYNKVLEFDPGFVTAWFNKALAEDQCGRRLEAAHSYRQFLAITPAQYTQQITYARNRLQELESK